MGILSHLISFFAIFAYLVSAFLYVRRFIFGNSSNRRLENLSRLSLFIAASSHLIFILFYSLSEFSLVETKTTNLPYALSIISVGTVFLFFILEKKVKALSKSASGVGAIIAPIAMIFMLTSSVLFHRDFEAFIVRERGLVFWIHVITSLFAHVFFLFAFILSVLLILQNYFLKNKKLKMSLKLPSVVFLDDLSISIIFLAFIFLAIGVFCGILFAIKSQVSVLSFDPRLISSLITLALYAFLLFLRFIKNVRGSRAAWLSVVGYLTLFLSFIGINLLGGSFHVY